MAARNDSSLDDEMPALERAGVTAVTWKGAGYTARLKEVADPPAVVFYILYKERCYIRNVATQWRTFGSDRRYQKPDYIRPGSRGPA